MSFMFLQSLLFPILDTFCMLYNFFTIKPNCYFRSCDTFNYWCHTIITIPSAFSQFITQHAGYRLCLNKNFFLRIVRTISRITRKKSKHKIVPVIRSRCLHIRFAWSHQQSNPIKFIMWFLKKNIRARRKMHSLQKLILLLSPQKY